VGVTAHRRDVHGGKLLPLLPRVVRVVLLVAHRQVGRQLCTTTRGNDHRLNPDELESTAKGLQPLRQGSQSCHMQVLCCSSCSDSKRGRTPLHTVAMHSPKPQIPVIAHELGLQPQCTSSPTPFLPATGKIHVAPHARAGVMLRACTTGVRPARCASAKSERRCAGRRLSLTDRAASA